MSQITNRIDQLFGDRSKKRFIPFLTIGDPSLEASFHLVQAIIDAGADAIELGVAYSDPLADGPTIQRASGRALAKKVSIRDVVLLVSRLREVNVTVPLILFTYYNPIFQYGIDQFFADLAANGADGVIIPDLPIEENEQAIRIAKAYNLHVISLVAPTSDTRIAKIGKKAEGFLYCVSSLGVTGIRTSLRDDLSQFLDKVRANTDAPIAVGFGISTPEQVKSVSQHADAVIVGSAIVQEIERNLPLLTDKKMAEQGIGNVKTFVQNLVRALQ